MLLQLKKRFGDLDVIIQSTEHNYSNRVLLLNNYVASTGRTLEETVMHTRKFQPASISVIITHAIFIGGAVQRLADAGVGFNISSDNIPHHMNQLSLVPMLAGSLLELIKAGAKLTPATCAV